MEADDPFRARKLFGAAVRRRRLERGLTQEQLSHESGLRQSYVSEIEAARRNVSIDNIQRLADVLGLPIGRFFDAEKATEVARDRGENDRQR